LSFAVPGGETTKIATVPSYNEGGFMTFDVNYGFDVTAGSGIDFLLSVNYTDAKKNSIDYTLSSNPADNNGNVYMLALDITELYNLTYKEDFESVFMFLWEDYKDGQEVYWSTSDKSSKSDWDYTDYMFIMTSVKSDNVATPEPATLAVLGLGLAGLGLTRIRRRK
jgi:hypothetical protein